MKKIVSLILALALVMSMSVTAFATENTGTLNDTTNRKEITVTGTYTAAQGAGTKVSVNITWDAMTFTYTEGAAGEWLPNEHKYAEDATGSWSTDTKTITVVNHSNAAVNATLTFDAAVNGIVGTFTETSGTADDGKLELATAENTTVANAPTASAEFGISGAAIDANKTLGTITVAIATATATN